MAGWTGLDAGVKALVLGGGAAAAVVVAAVIWQARTAPDLFAPDPPAPDAAAPTPEAAAPAPDTVQPAPVEVAAPAGALPEPPSFDVVRVEPDGATLVAGRAEAGQEVAVMVDGAEASVAVADLQGRFVVFLTLASSTSARIMTLELRPAGSAVIPSEDQVLLAPSVAAAPDLEGVAKAPAAEPPVEVLSEAAEPRAAPVPEVAAAPVAEPAPEVAAPPVAEPAPEVAAPPVAQPAPEVAVAPVAEPAPEVPEVPVADAAAEVAAAPVAEPAPEVAEAPAAEPEREVAAAPAAEPEPEPSVSAADATPAQTPATSAVTVADPAPPEASAAEPLPEAVATARPLADPAPAALATLEEAESQAVVVAAEPAPEPGQVVADPSIVAAAPTALLLTGNTVKVLQSAANEAAAPSGTVIIDAISYTAGGEIALSGRGKAQAFVRLYLDNRPLLETAIAEDGTWGGTLPAVAPGVYTLRADQVSAAGQVTSRYETPFQREDPAALATTAPTAVDQTGTIPDAATPNGRVSITVQPGFTLWQIARENYGDGTLYVRVYDANKTLIRDPDLIYPGQVFSVPAGN